MSAVARPSWTATVSTWEVFGYLRLNTLAIDGCFDFATATGTNETAVLYSDSLCDCDGQMAESAPRRCAARPGPSDFVGLRIWLRMLVAFLSKHINADGHAFVAN